MDELNALSSLGFSMPSPVYLAGAILFGIVGMVACRRGKVDGNPLNWILGVALMFYPYAISETWLLYLIGVILCGIFYYLNYF